MVPQGGFQEQFCRNPVHGNVRQTFLGHLHLVEGVKGAPAFSQRLIRGNFGLSHKPIWLLGAHVLLTPPSHSEGFGAMR
jgi:hypothetical protein